MRPCGGMLSQALNYVQQDLLNEDLYLPLDFKMISAKVSTTCMAPCAYCASYIC